MNKYSSELKEQIIKEVNETKNITLVANNHNLNHKTVWNWVNRKKNESKFTTLKTIQVLEKKLLDSELENQILKELLKKTNQVWLSDSK